MRKIMMVCFAVLLLFSACGERQEGTEDPGPVVTETAAPETTAPAVTEPPATGVPETDAPEPPPEETPEPTPEPTEIIADAQFADAAFLGNSLVDGLRMFGGLEQGDFFAMESASVVNIGSVKNTVLSDGREATLIEALCEGDYGKIFVLLGVNEISFAPDYFVHLYSGMLDGILQKEPNAEIYVMSLTPVTKAKNDEGSYFTMAAVNAYNNALRALAEERGYHYIDLVDALAGEDGFLPEENSTDGIHLTREIYPAWADYLRSHVN